MKKLTFIFFTLLFIGCASKNEKDKKTTFIPTPTGLSGIKQTAPSNLSLNNNRASTNLITNPKHGEPGHRCDIAVGAPLNTNKQQIQPQQSPTAAQATQVAQTAPSIKATSFKGGGLNPKHGEPGHRCDIAVGAPLNSAKKQNKTIKIDQNITPPPTTQRTTTENKNQKLNPPHGQPEHRCDLAVGAPLN